MNEFDRDMLLRAEAARFFDERVKKCFDAAFGDINCDLYIGFSHEYGTMDVSDGSVVNGKLTLYTNRPGIVIGKAGCNIDKLKAAFKEEFGFEYNVNIKEIKSGIYFHPKREDSKIL